MSSRGRSLALVFVIGASLTVRAVMADNSPTETPTDGAARPLSLADAISLALDQSPTLTAARQQVAGKTAQVTEATANFLPKLEVQESFTRSDNPTFAFK